MSLRFYFALLAVCVGMFGSNVHSISDGGLDIQSLFSQGSPRRFLSVLADTSCPYSKTIDCKGKTEQRTIDGSCNNDKSPYFGKSVTPYIRVLPSSYIGGKTPRTKTYFGRPLVAPRELTLKFFANMDAAKKVLDDPPSATLSNVVSVFTRFVEQDLYNTELSGANCCPKPSTPTVACSSIILEPTDPYFAKYGKTCLSKPNAKTSRDLKCSDAVNQQVNTNTHFLDLSNIYGSTDAKNKEVRTLKDGLLKLTVEGTKKPLLPKTTLKNCASKTTSCFLTGDSRGNIDPLQMAMYTVWVRLHNEIAKLYKGINSALSDEQLFQESRKIVIAIYQNIVYNEFLPVLNSGTKLKTPATATTWGNAVKPQIENRFSIAFTALADTLTPGKFTVGSGKIDLKSVWYNPDKLWEGDDGVKPIVEGMFVDAAAKVDRFYTQALYDQYLETVLGNGMDKSAWNVQQSRDNGLIGYYAMSAIQKGDFSSAFKPLDTNFEADVKKKIEELYKNVYEIDFLPGLLGEKYTSPAAEIGPLMASILEKQFQRLRDGDKFFFHHKGQFEDAQLSALKKLTLSKIFCETIGPIKLKEKAFVSGGADKPCTDIEPKGKLLDICVWAGDGWSKPTVTPCVGGFSFETRECQFAPDSPCTCKGSPIIIKSCPSNVQHIMTNEMRRKIEEDYSKYFDSQGHARDGVNVTPEQVAEDILIRVVGN